MGKHAVVYTTEDRPLIAEEGVQIVGKEFPSSWYGNFIAKYPLGIFLGSIIVSVVFFLIFVINTVTIFSCSGNDLQIAASVPAQRAVAKQKLVRQYWAESTTGVDALTKLLNTSNPKSVVADRVELRMRVDTAAMLEYYKNIGLGISDAILDRHSNMLDSDNLMMLRMVENALIGHPVYSSICFTNNLRGGVVNGETPDCAPVSSLTQYYYPTIAKQGEEVLLDGAGSIYQLGTLPRVLRNPSYVWYVDNSFDTGSGHATAIRSQFMLANVNTGLGETDYEKERKTFIDYAFSVVRRLTVPYIDIAIGGESVDCANIRDAISKESYKFALAIIITLVCAVIHSKSVCIGLYAAAQLTFSYTGALGMFFLIYNTMPLVRFPCILVMIPFSVHGTLAFYDAFVHSGVMATTGRRNTLSMNQRLSFCIRRTSYGVFISNLVAIITFAVNTTSIFGVVFEFSVSMMIALLFNLVAIFITTPAFVAFHHFHFSNHRRSLQKRMDIVKRHLSGVTRSQDQVALAAVLEENRIGTERAYRGPLTAIYSTHYGGIKKDATICQRIGFLIGKHYGVLRAGGLQAAVTLNRMNEMRKTRLQQMGPVGESGVPRVNNQELPAFSIDDFAEVGQNNPLETLNDGQEAKRKPFVNFRMVSANNILHIPPELTERSVPSWTVMTAALTAAGKVGNKDDTDDDDDNDNEAGGGRTAPATKPPPVPALPGPRDSDALIELWSQVGQRVGVARKVDSHESDPRRALITRQLFKSADTQWIITPEAVGTGTERPAPPGAAGTGPSAQGGDGAATGAPVILDEGVSGMNLRKLRYRWKHRHEEGTRRSMFCGMFGSRADESVEQREARIMNRKIKRESYTYVELALMRFGAIGAYRARWFLLTLLVALTIVTAVFGSKIKAAAPPTSLLSTDANGRLFATLGQAFTDTGSCDLCGGYYRPLTEYRVATASQMAVCAAANYLQQMNMVTDSCGVCNGNGTCLDCARVPNGDHYLSSCGACVNASSPDVCSCAATRECSWCEWHEGVTDGGGAGCASTCSSSTTCGSGGSCNQYTAKCDCDAHFSGATCNACADGYVAIADNPTCTAECSATVDSAMCQCNTATGTCTPCADRSYFGVNCDVPVLTCVHGKFNYNPANPMCVCDSGFNDGNLCEYADNCSSRGVWLSADESPFGTATCGCLGHWRGATCQLCDCQNGGMCDSTGKCSCVGGFAGDRCQHCSSTCEQHGTCPESIPTNLWSVRTCIPELCTAQETQNEVVCSACEGSLDYSRAACKDLPDEWSCKARSACWWDLATTTCTGAQGIAISDFVDTLAACTCPDGVWSGVQCQVCQANGGAYCTNDSSVIGCDGLMYAAAGDAPSLDVCGVCGGNAECVGCDGVVWSWKRYDSCGVCGGNGTCSAGTSLTATILYDFTNAVDNPLSLSGIITYTCSLYFSLPYVARINTNCIFAQFSSSTETTVDQLYDYANTSGRLSEVVFSYDGAGNPLDVLYMMHTLRLRVTTTSDAADIFDAYSSFRSLTDQRNDVLGSYGFVLSVSSTSWLDGIAVTLSKLSLWFAVGISIAVTFGLAYTLFASLTSSVLITTGVISIVFGTLTVCSFMGWSLDSVLQTCISPATGVAVEYLYHTVLGYYDFVEGATSHLFAMDISRLSAVRGAMVKSLPSVLTTLFISTISAIMYDLSPIIFYERMGQTTITMNFITFIVIVLMCGGLGAIGPLENYRTPALIVTVAAALSLIGLLCVAFIAAGGGILSPSGNRLL